MRTTIRDLSYENHDYSPFYLMQHRYIYRMKNTQFEVAIIGGASAGLSAALSLGRSARKTVVFDTGAPRNKPAAHAQNIFTRDGTPPLELLAIGREQLRKYPSVEIRAEKIVAAEKEGELFLLTTTGGDAYLVRKVILATGVADQLPAIPGIRELWGNKAIHCPYCHGWETKDGPAAIIGNDAGVVHQAPVILNLNKELTIFTNGKSTFDSEQHALFQKRGVPVIETPVVAVKDEGEGIRLILEDGQEYYKRVAYVRVEKLIFHNELAIQLGCELDEAGAVKVGEFQESTVPGVFAAGDLSHPMMHQVALAAAGGGKAGAFCNGQLCREDFEKA